MNEDALNLDMVLLIAVAVIAVVSVLLLIVLLVSKNVKKKNEEDFFKIKLHQIIRDEAIDKALNDYKGEDNSNHWLLRVYEKNSFDTKEHFFDLKEDVTIGRDFNLNKLCVYDGKADKVQGKIAVRKNIAVYENLSADCDTYLFAKRKHGRNIAKRTKVKQEINLFSKDKLSFGNTEISVVIYNEGKGII